MPRVWKLAYQFRIYHLGSWTLERWGMTLAIGAALLLVLQWVIRGSPPTPWWHWLAPAGLLGGVVGWVALRRQAAAAGYVQFQAETGIPAPGPLALEPRDKIQVHATGHFEVENRSGDFVNLLSYWRTFTSREHAVMAILHPSRFLLIGSLPEEALGMWYIFIQSADIHEVTPGRLTFGADEGLALRLRYARLQASSSEKKPPRAVEEVAYLKFEDDDARRRVWADLLADTT